MLRAVLRDLSAFALLGAVAACAPSILTPPTGPGTEYPCGISGHQCAGGGCCSNDSTCCDGTTCTAGYCEFLGVDEAVRPDASGARRVVPQYTPARP